MDEARFRQYVSEVLEELPDEFKQKLKNVEFIIEEEPNDLQRQELHLRKYDSLYGLYTGVPQTVPGEDRATMPDRITLFRLPIIHSHDSEEGIKQQIKNTVHHEIGHYFGIDETTLRSIQKTNS